MSLADRLRAVPEIPRLERLRRFAMMVWATIGFLLLAWAVLRAADSVRIIWLPLAFAGGLTLLLSPVVNALERVRIPRLVGTVFAFLVASSVIAASIVLLVPAIREQGSAFAIQLPSLYDNIVEWLHSMSDTFGVDFGEVWTSTGQYCMNGITRGNGRPYLQVERLQPTDPLGIIRPNPATLLRQLTSNGEFRLPRLPAEPVADWADAFPGEKAVRLGTDTLTLGGPPAGCSVNRQEIECVAGTLAVGASETFTVTATIDASATGTLANTATVTSTTPDSDTDNNTSTASRGLGPLADLEVTKTVSESTDERAFWM